MSKKVFISCSSNSINQIKSLIERLKDDGIDVVCQQTGFHGDSTSYLEQNIRDSSYNNILIICDSNYKEVIDTEDIDVEAIDTANTVNKNKNKNEPIISEEMYKTLDQTIKSKIILIVYDCNSIPKFLSSEKNFDFSNFMTGYRKLLYAIFNEENEGNKDNDGIISSQSIIETRLSELPIIEYKGYLDIDIDNSSLTFGENDIVRLKLVFSNITNNRITCVSVESTDQLVSDLRNTTWLRNKEDPKHAGVVITNYETCSYNYLELLNGKSFTCNIQFKRYNQTFCMICLKVTNKTIYGLKTVQLFTILTIGKTIFPAHIESIS